VHGCHVFLPRLRKNGRGHIINVASVAGLCAGPGMAPYCATKAAVVALSEALHGELAGSGVGVTVVCPTFFQTSIAASARGSTAQDMRPVVEKMMARAKIQANDVARLALEAAARGQLYALPHADGRWMWRFKRLAPMRYASLTERMWRRIAR
jgi:short-subunit dehydrogenase